MSTPIEDLEKRSYLTYSSRLQAWRRLKARDHAWNTFLIALSISSTVAAIALLVDVNVFGVRGELLLVVLSVFAFAASLVIPTMNYSGRAQSMFSNYRRIQQLSSEIEQARKLGLGADPQLLSDFLKKYQVLLDDSENQVEADFAKSSRLARKFANRNRIARLAAQRSNPALIDPGDLGDNIEELFLSDRRHASEWGEIAITALPFLALVVPIILILRLVIWIFGG